VRVETKSQGDQKKKKGKGTDHLLRLESWGKKPKEGKKESDPTESFFQTEELQERIKMKRIGEVVFMSQPTDHLIRFTWSRGGGGRIDTR